MEEAIDSAIDSFLDEYLGEYPEVEYDDFVDDEVLYYCTDDSPTPTAAPAATPRSWPGWTIIPG